MELDPGQGSLQLAGMGVSKLLTRQARHAFMLMMAGIWTEAIALASLVFDQSRGHNSIKRRYNIFTTQILVDSFLKLIFTFVLLHLFLNKSCFCHLPLYLLLYLKTPLKQVHFLTLYVYILYCFYLYLKNCFTCNY